MATVATKPVSRIHQVRARARRLLLQVRAIPEYWPERAELLQEFVRLHREMVEALKRMPKQEKNPSRRG